MAPLSQELEPPPNPARFIILQDHIFRLRASKSCGIPSYLLLAALSISFVRRQVRSRQFSADIIDKIGNRHLRMHVPIPRDALLQKKLVEGLEDVLDMQAYFERKWKKLVSQSLD